jgi:hypothetical protein
MNSFFFFINVGVINTVALSTNNATYYIVDNYKSLYLVCRLIDIRRVDRPFVIVKEILEMLSFVLLYKLNKELVYDL